MQINLLFNLFVFFFIVFLILKTNSVLESFKRKRKWKKLKKRAKRKTSNIIKQVSKAVVSNPVTCNATFKHEFHKEMNRDLTNFVNCAMDLGYRSCSVNAGKPAKCRSIKEVANATKQKDNVKRACGPNSMCNPWHTRALNHNIGHIAVSLTGADVATHADLPAQKNKNNLGIHCSGITWKDSNNIKYNTPLEELECKAAANNSIR